MKLERWALATLLLIAAAFFAFIGAGALSNLWADYQDGTDGTYIVGAAICGVVAAGLIVAAIGLVRGWFRRR